MAELSRNHRLELHRLARHGMVEAQHIGMQTKTVDRVVAVAILDVAAYGMPHIGRVYADLVLAPRLELELHQTVLRGAVEGAEMRNGILSAVVHRRRIGHVCL